MVASYPQIVRKFQTHVDGTQYVMAADVNAVQDEVSAVETILGPQPQVYTNAVGVATTYATVRARMDATQQKLDAQQAQINSLTAASQTGWSLPIASVLATGTNIPPTASTSSPQPSDWYPLRWTQAITDTSGVYSPSYHLTIPQSGWWIVTITCAMPNPADGITTEHVVWGRLRVTSSTSASQQVQIDIAQGDSTIDGVANGFHRLTMATAADFYVGDQLQVQLRHDFLPSDDNGLNPSKYALTATSRTQLTYIRGLPGSPTYRPLGSLLGDGS